MSSVIRRNPPSTAIGAPFVLPPASRAVLSNGLRVWTIERRRLPMVSVVLLVPAGSAIDPPHQCGLASLTADMLDEGAAGLSALQIQEAFARLGTSLETDAGTDSVWLSLSVMPPQLDAACDLLFACAGAPALASADFDRIRTLRLNRLQQLKNVPSALADHVFQRAAFGTHPYAWPSYGTTNSISALTIDDVTRMHRQAWTPSRATLVVVGDVDSDRAVQIAERAAQAWGGAALESGQPPAASSTPPTAETDVPRLFLVDRPGSAQTELRIGHIAVSRHTPDYHALVLLNAALGGQFVSRLNLNLRERMACTYGAHSAFELRRMAGAFSVQTSVAIDATAEAVRQCLDEVRSIRAERPPTPDEISFCSGALTNGYARGFETTGQLARAMAQLAAYDLPADTFDQFVPRIRALTPADLSAAAHAHLRPDEIVTVCVGDRARIEASLAALNLGAPAITTVQI